MRFQRLALRNFKCFDEADLDLGPGVTVIHGVNGSGKSSLLEACFFALYGAPALDRTLSEVVTIGEDEAEVELWFLHAGGDYRVRRRIRVRDEGAKTVEAVLDGPEGVYEGARDVRARVAELLRMDAGAFLNCAYVRQGEVNKLIEATPGERQDMLDDLLQLGKLEDYRERASNARVGVGRVRDAKRELLDSLDEQIAEKEDSDLHSRKNDLETELAEVGEEIDHYEDQREEAARQRDEMAQLLEDHERKQAELEALREDVEALETKITETERERERLQAELDDLLDRREELAAALEEALAETALDGADGTRVNERLSELREADEEVRDAIESHRVEAQEHASEVERLGERADDLETRAESKREEAAELEADLAEKREALGERRSELEELEDEIEAKRAAFDDAPVDVGTAEDHREGLAEELADCRERETELSTALEAARADVEEAEALLEAGKCPECGQPVEGAPHVESLDQYRERVEDLEDELATARDERAALEERLERATELSSLASEIADIENRRDSIDELIEERERGLEEAGERIAALEQEAGELEEEAAEARESAAEAEARAEECRERIAECNQERAEIREAIDALERVAESLEEVEEVEGGIEERRRQREEKAALNEERRDRLAEKRTRRDELAAEFDEERIAEAAEKRDEAEAYLEDVEDKLAELDERRDELTSRIGALSNEIEELESLRDRRADLAETVENLESLYEEAEQLQELYGTVRAELRRRNVETLERLVNETFELVYEADAYSRIELDGDYRLTVYQKDGEALAPEQLSGGERALFNLSLRCGIYRLLAEGIEGAAPMPPLILDEPTVYLDSGHVSRLVELIGAMYELGVEQILVVSHDEELVAAADDLVRVRTDATTNRSTVERVRGADAAVLAGAD